MIQKLGAMWKKDPGLVVSGGAHVLAFLLLISNFSWAHKFDDQVESVPVEMITSSELNQIMNGEKTAKQMPEAQRRVDQVAALEDKKSEPPIPDSKKDTPPPPSPEKANADPGHDDKPTEEANAPPPPPTPPKPPEPVKPPPPAVPTPPERPVEKTEAAPKVEDQKPPPEEAEAIEPKPMPQPRPKIEAKKPPKKIAKVPPKKPVPPVKPVQEAKEVPDPPRKPVPPTPPEPSLKERTLDQVAKLLDTMKPPKPVVKQKSGNEVKEAKRSEFSLDKIATLLDHDTPQRTASKGQKLTQLASLGSPTAHAEKMSPALMAQIDGWLIDHYRGCWSYFGLGASTDYVPKIHVMLSRDGSLMARPVLVNQPSDPNLRSLADSAMRAVNKCNPMPIPDWFKAHYEHWRDRTVRFDPKEMS